MSEIRKTEVGDLMSEVRLLEPATIFAEIDARPPLMRPQAIEKYRGAEVDWPVTLANAREQRPGEIHAVFYGDPNENGLARAMYHSHSTRNCG